MRKVLGGAMLLVGLLLAIGVLRALVGLGSGPLSQGDGAYRAGYVAGQFLAMLVMGWLAWRAITGGWRRLTTDAPPP